MFLSTLLVSVLLQTATFGMPADPGSSKTKEAVSQETDTSTSESDASPEETGSTGWQHPGFVVSRSQLDFVKTQVDAEAQPWSDALAAMLKDEDDYGKYASDTRSSKAVEKVRCGPQSKPDTGCTDERGDALAAWASALAGFVSGDKSHTKNAITLMNKWSKVIEGKSCCSHAKIELNY